MPKMGQSSDPQVPGMQIISSCRSDKISSVFSSFDSHKVRILKTLGFDGLLKVPLILNCNDELTLWLYQKYDFNKSCLHLDGGVDLDIRPPDVNLVFGIPFDGRVVDMDMNQSIHTITHFQEKLFCGCSSPSLSMDFIEHILLKDYRSGFSVPEIDAFRIATVLFCVCYLLAPEIDHDFPFYLIKNFLPDVKPADINWANLVLGTLDRASVHARDQVSHGSKMISLFGCSLFLQIFYLDNLNFGPSTPYHSVLPRASVYLPDIMTKLIQLDSTASSEHISFVFGNKARQTYDVCYTRGWREHVRMQAHLQNVSPDDYLTSIENLFEGFFLLEKFASQLNKTNWATQYGDQRLIEDIRNSYVKYRATLNEKMHCLSAKAADLIQRRNLILGSPHIRQEIPLMLHNALSIVADEQMHNPVIKEESSTSSSELSSLAPKIVRSHSNFPLKFTTQMFGHPDVQSEHKYICYLWMSSPSLPKDELRRGDPCYLCSTRIRFDAPKPLSITGHVVQHCLKLNGAFTASIVDATMVIWSYLDEKNYNYFLEQKQPYKIWRHFLPASFAEMFLDNVEYLNSTDIRASFIGGHIKYAVEDCQQIILPVEGNTGSWSCYIWDFKLSTTYILDPVLMNSSPTIAKQKHQHTVYKVHTALFACIHHFFSGWDVKPNGWTEVYLTDLGHKCTPQNSGLYAVHYARSFWGPKKLAFNLKEPYEPTLCEARGEIVYHLFTCSENKVYKPELLMEKISYFEM